MREIKFRCWNGETMVSPDYIDRDGVAHWKENSIPESTDKVMQYTGRKDKNGEEIYEGDIVRDKIVNWRTGKPQTKYRIFEVYWDNDEASFWQKIIKDPSKRFRSGTNFDIAKECKVIGNIYETPELLKEK